MTLTIAKVTRKMYLCTQNNGRVPFLGLGCPRSEELSGSWQLFSFYGWLG